MTDLEMTRLCADAMGIKIRWNDYLEIFQSGTTPGDIHHYAPLHDDAQAMALVKKFRLALTPMLGSNDDVWAVGGDDGIIEIGLNRAICECVAKMQQGVRKLGSAAQ